LLIVGLLTFQLLVGAALVYFSHNDPSFAVEEDYYRRGIEWDKQLAQQRLDEEMGWGLAVEVDGPVVGESGDTMRTVRVRLSDRDGLAIEGAEVGLVCYHHARAGDRIELALAEVEPGVYERAGPLAREGRWAFQFTVHHGDDVFTSNIEQWISDDGGE
jgi:nitrogen fixation protein FixH